MIAGVAAFAGLVILALGQPMRRVLKT